MDELTEIINAIEKYHGLISIDGRSGSGKTTLASFVAEKLACDVIHMDDFYMPIPERAANWMDIPAGNMDLDRLRTCVTDAHGLVLIEGSYSQHPSLAKLYDLRIFLTCSTDEQKNRLAKREGKYFEEFFNLWVPLEEKYFASFDIRSRADIVVDTTLW